MVEDVLQIRDVSVRYGKLPALEGITLSLRRGEAVGLLGANGAGKTTLLNTLSGFLRPSAGSIMLLGEPLERMAPHTIVRNGLLHVSQERDLFGDLTVLDNLKLAAMTRPADRFEKNVARVFGFFPRLKERVKQRAATMSGGEQQMLAMGRALMAEPRVLLFDEPSAGLSPLFVDEIGNMMRTLRDDGDIAILLVEQNMLLAAKVISRFHILRAGTMVAEGPVADLDRNHAELAREFYL